MDFYGSPISGNKYPAQMKNKYDNIQVKALIIGPAPTPQCQYRYLPEAEDWLQFIIDS